MGRQSSKHSPRVDEQLKHEGNALLQGPGEGNHARVPEAPVGDEPMVDLTERPDVPMPDGPMAIDPAEARERSELARHLAGVDWPAAPPVLAAAAAKDYAPDQLVERIVGLPADVRYENVGEVWAAMGGTLETRDA